MVHGADRVERNYIIAKNLTISMFVYSVAVTVVYYILTKVAGGIIEGVAI